MREEFIIPFDSVPFGINLFATDILLYFDIRLLNGKLID